MIYVILLEPVTAGNVGAVARAMSNFGFERLVIINPHCDHLGTEARNRAKHAQKILEDAEVTDFFIVDDYDYLVATTARLGTDYNIPRSPMKPDELARKLKGIDPKKKIGLVIGRETTGMFNEEIAKCDFIVTIPSHEKYPTLNISHAVVVLLYELHKELSATDITKHITPIGKPEKDQITRMFEDIFNSMSWETPEKKETQRLLWKKIIGKSMLTRREAYGMMGFLRKVLWQGKAGGVKGKHEERPVPTKKHTNKAAPKTPQKSPIKNKPAAAKIRQAFPASRSSTQPSKGAVKPGKSAVQASKGSVKAGKSAVQASKRVRKPTKAIRSDYAMPETKKK